MRGTLPILRVAQGLCAVLGLSACSVERYAVDRLGDALAGGGTNFASDDDPELIRQAVPFSLKLVESLLRANPRHEGLLFAAASGFTQYAYAFVQEDADEIEATSLARATELRTRARKLYLRARGYGLRGLDLRHPGFEAALRADPKRALEGARPEDVALLYWTAAAWAGAINLAKDDPETVADLPLVEAMMDRGLALDEDFSFGAIHAFLISYESSRPGGAREADARARAHYARAVELTGGNLAGPMVALAEAVALPRQDRKEFEGLLARALAVDENVRPEWRLENLIMKRRARWLLDHLEDHFVE
jgi:predicted anti-sigma-YlaC factor YlaD